MDAIKLIPQLFYDVISRVIPGVVALVLVAAAMGSDLGALVVGPFRGAVALQQSPLFLAIGVIGASYIAGAMISPVSDFYERYVVGALMPRSFWLLPAALAPGSHFPAAMQRFLVRELGLSEESRALAAARFRGALFVWYDWLRVWQPQAGSRVEKIRSEYRMFGGVAVGACAAVVVHLTRALLFGATLQPVFAVLGLLLFLFASWGMARMFRTFERSVVNQYYVSKEDPVRPAQPAAEPVEAK